MKLKLIQVSRRPPWPLWAVLIVSMWLAVGGATVVLSAHLETPIRLCMLKRISGLACPTCGFTRGALSLLRGDVLGAWLFNPLLYTAFALLFFSAAMRVLFARSVQIELTHTERLVSSILVVVLFLANWAYVIVCVG